MISKTSEGFLESDTIETAHLNRREAEKWWCCWFNMRHLQMLKKWKKSGVYKLKALREKCGYSQLTQFVITLIV